MRGGIAAECDSKHLMDRRSEVSEAAGWTAVLGGLSPFPPFCPLCRLGFFLIGTFHVSRGREWQPTPVLLPGESHGQRSLAGFSPWGHKE